MGKRNSSERRRKQHAASAYCNASNQSVYWHSLYFGYPGTSWNRSRLGRLCSADYLRKPSDIACVGTGSRAGEARRGLRLRPLLRHLHEPIAGVRPHDPDGIRGTYFDRQALSGWRDLADRPWRIDPYSESASGLETHDAMVVPDSAGWTLHLAVDAEAALRSQARLHHSLARDFDGARSPSHIARSVSANNGGAGRVDFANHVWSSSAAGTHCRSTSLIANGSNLVRGKFVYERARRPSARGGIPSAC